MKFSDAMNFIDECNLAGIVPGLDSIKSLCDRIGNPQDRLKFVHIAGTNGKGSSLAYISTILSTAGYRVGRYISPTICSYLERFQINGRVISKAAFCRYVELVKGVCDEIVAEGFPHPTAFEVETAIAFLYFFDKKCDLVVLECGMGGRGDATNIVKTTVLEVFAHIDMDHMQFLGESLEEIAYEKAGIIKDNSSIVSIGQYKEVKGVLTKEAILHNSNITFLDEQKLEGIKYSIKGQSFKLNGIKYMTPLLGIHQVDNAALAVLALKELNSLGYEISEDDILKGLLKTNWPARMELISNKPLFLIDGAHNPDAARSLKASLDIYFPKKRRIIILGMFRDKAVDEVVSILCKDAWMVLTIATPDNPRAMSSVELGKVVREYNNNVTTLDSVEEAIEMAGLLSDDDCITIACGSLAYLGRIINYFEKKSK